MRSLLSQVSVGGARLFAAAGQRAWHPLFKSALLLFSACALLSRVALPLEDLALPFVSLCLLQSTGKTLTSKDHWTTVTPSKEHCHSIVPLATDVY